MGSINLRALTSEDAKVTWQWRNKEEVMSLYSGHPFPVNYEMEKNWYDKIMFSNLPTTVFGVELVNDNAKQLIGITTLTNINLINRNSEFSIIIGNNEHRGKGYAKEATLHTLLFAFNELGLNKVALKVREGNTNAIKLYEKIGFEPEGLLKQNIFQNNDFHNEIVMAIFKKSFIK